MWCRVMMELENANHASVPGVDLFPVSAVKIQVERASLHSNSPTYVPRARSFRRFSETPEACLKWGYPGSIQPWVRARVYLEVGTPR
jgi:hypothetical protein